MVKHGHETDIRTGWFPEAERFSTDDVDCVEPDYGFFEGRIQAVHFEPSRDWREGLKASTAEFRRSFSSNFDRPRVKAFVTWVRSVSSAAAQPALLQAGVVDDIPPDVKEFCINHDLYGYLDTATDLAKRYFATAEKIEYELEHDPDSADQWVILRVVVSGDADRLLSARKGFSADWVKDVPSPQRFLIRLSLDIV